MGGNLGGVSGALGMLLDR